MSDKDLTGGWPVVTMEPDPEINEPKPGKNELKLCWKLTSQGNCGLYAAHSGPCLPISGRPFEAAMLADNEITVQPGRFEIQYPRNQAAQPGSADDFAPLAA